MIARRHIVRLWSDTAIFTARNNAPAGVPSAGSFGPLVEFPPPQFPEIWTLEQKLEKLRQNGKPSKPRASGLTKVGAAGSYCAGPRVQQI